MSEPGTEQTTMPPVQVHSRNVDPLPLQLSPSTISIARNPDTGSMIQFM
jgi:hypothetical protein